MYISVIKLKRLLIFKAFFIFVLYGQNREPKLSLELHLRDFSIPSSFDTIKAKYALGFSKLDEGLLTAKYLELEFIVACHFQLITLRSFWKWLLCYSKSQMG